MSKRLTTIARHAAPEARRKPPLAAKIGAAILLLGLVIGVPSCLAAQGAAYDACIQQIAQTEGHEAAEMAMRDGECR